MLAPFREEDTPFYEGEVTRQITKSLSELIEVAPSLYKTLPVQTIHADYLCPNVLVHQNQVVGILDFEFATYDLRLLDYVSALDHFT